MSREEFLEKYQNRNWYFLLENEEVKKFVLDYPNERTRVNICQTVYDLVRGLNETDPDVSISNLLDLDAISAREKIWEVILNYIDKEKYRTARSVKVYAKQLYDVTHEMRRDPQSISWRRNHNVPDIRVRKTTVPTHDQIYRLVDKTTHIRSQAMILLSYSSGLKGSGIINLQIGHLKQAITFKEKLKQEFLQKRNNTYDPKAQKDLDELINNLPLILRIDAKIYFKRFRNGGKDWFPALVCRDAEEVLMKYYTKMRANAGDDEPLFVTSNGRKYSQVELSKNLRYNIRKFSKSTGELRNTSPSLLRRSFYNRLIAGNVKDVHREYIMGHALGIKGHYFDWESNKQEIILSYIRCNFNRIADNVTREITSLKEDSISKDAKIKELEKQLQYFKSKEFTSDLVVKIKENDELFNRLEIGKPKKLSTKVIKIGDAKAWKKLNKEGYYLISSDDEHFVMQKEIEE